MKAAFGISVHRRPSVVRFFTRSQIMIPSKIAIRSFFEKFPFENGLTEEIYQRRRKAMKTNSQAFIAFLFLILPPLSFAETLTKSDNIRIEFQPNRRVKEVMNASVGAKAASFSPVLKIKNSSIKDFSNVRICIIMMGQDTNNPKIWRVLMKKVIEKDLPSSETITWEGETFNQAFDKIMAKSGYEYDGYVVLLKNNQDEIVNSFASKSFWISNPAFAWDLKQGQTYTKEDFR